jgi:hypothetical protein
MTAVLLALGRKSVHNAWPSRIDPFEDEKSMYPGQEARKEKLRKLLGKR